MFAYCLFGFAALCIVYSIGLYPLLLAVVPWRKAPPIRKDLEYQPSVTAIVAVHNGAAFLRRKLDTLLALDYCKSRFDIIVVSDGSTDDTAAIASEYSSKGVTLIDAPRAGKSAALNLGIAKAKGEILFFTDVRQPLDLQALRHLAANFADPSVGACTGEMHLVRGDSGEQADMDLYWRYEIWARKIHSSIDSLFSVTGCVYALRRHLARPIPPDSLTDDAVLSLNAFFEGFRVVFDPAAIAFDYPALPGTEFRRRFRTLAGLWQIHVRKPGLFGPSNRMWFHFMSHKFSRLALPWAVLLFLVSSLFLPGRRFPETILLLEAASIALMLLNRFVPDGWRLKRLTSPARTFATMNVAALAAIAVFFVPANRLWTPTRVQNASKPLR
jgi:cellulose synthase/poly-beta-1,6-N-acetylglucosamine synthase-like glycosyltransferase